MTSFMSICVYKLHFFLLKLKNKTGQQPYDNTLLIQRTSKVVSCLLKNAIESKNSLAAFLSVLS